MIYYIVFFVSIVLFSLYLVIRGTDWKDVNLIDWVCYFIISSPLVILSLIRSVEVGTDTSVYYVLYDRYNNISFNEFFDSLSLFSEPIFQSLQYISSSFINLEFNVFLSICTLFISVISLQFIVRYCKIPLLGYMLFLLMGFATLHFNILRQCLAVALYFIAIQTYFSNRNIQFVLVLIIGFLIHKSFLFVWLSFFCFRFLKILNLRAIIIILVFFGLFVFSIDFLVSISIGYDNRYSQLGISNDQGLGVMKFIFTLLTFIFAYYIQITSKADKEFINYVVFALFLSALLSALAVLLGLNPNGITRASIYFEPLFVFIIPLFILRFNNLYLRSFLILLTLSVYIVYFWYFVLPYGDLVPFYYWS